MRHFGIFAGYKHLVHRIATSEELAQVLLPIKLTKFPTKLHQCEEQQAAIVIATSLITKTIHTTTVDPLRVLPPPTRARR